MTTAAKRFRTLALGYIRVSTDRQSTEGSSMAAQERELRAIAKARQWDISIVRDAGISGKSMANRPGLLAAIERLNAGDADVLMATKLDRIARSTLDFADLLDQAAKSRKNGAGGGWVIKLAEPDIDITNAFGEAMATIVMAFGQLERKLIAGRVKDGMAQKKREGAVFGADPLPLDVVERIVFSPHLETVTVKGRRNRAGEWVAEHEARRGWSAIAADLTAAGVPTPQAGRFQRPTQWWPSTVRDVAMSPLTVQITDPGVDYSGTAAVMAVCAEWPPLKPVEVLPAETGRVRVVVRAEGWPSLEAVLEALPPEPPGWSVEVLDRPSPRPAPRPVDAPFCGNTYGPPPGPPECSCTEFGGQRTLNRDCPRHSRDYEEATI